MSKIISARFIQFPKRDIERVISFSQEIPLGVLSVKKRSWYAGDLKRFRQTPVTMGLIAHPVMPGTCFIIAHTKINQIQYSQNHQQTHLAINPKNLDLTIEKARFRPEYSTGWQNYSFYFDADESAFERNAQAVFFPS